MKTKNESGSSPFTPACEFPSMSSSLGFVVAVSDRRCRSKIDATDLPTTLRFLAFALLLSLSILWCFSTKAFAQSAGQAEVALQGYYLGGNGQPLIDTSGMALNFKEFIPGVGLLDGNLEGYGGSGFHSGTNFVSLEQAPLWGWKWDFTGGDFQFHYNMVDNPFLNIYTPDMSGRGARIVVRRKNRTYQFFVGEETLLGGPRVPYRISLPQLMMGASLWQKVGDHWEFGVRYTYLGTDSSVLTTDSAYFFPGHNYQRWNGVTFQSNYHFTKNFKFYTEATGSTASSFTPAPARQEPFSLLLGPAWDTDKFSIRANYALQSTTYLPMLGTFVGDRKGPYAEGHYRPVKWVDLYASANEYSNNLENNPQLPTYHSSGETSGASVLLPWKFSANVSLSTLHLTVHDPAVLGESISNNRELNLSLTRPLHRHSLRLTYIDMDLNSNTAPLVQRFTEFEDTFTWKRLVMGGAVREQNSKSTANTNTLFYRGSLSTNFKRVSAYGYFEKGNDLVNKSVFSTNAYSSSMAGVSTPLRGGWTLHLEAFRNNLLTSLNPENIFLFGNTGLGLNSELATMNQWNVFVRISKQFHWGRGFPEGGNIEDYTAVHAPLTGSVRGLVLEKSISGSRPAPNVAVSLDHYRSVVTDPNGYYDFGSVPEGPHEVGLDMEQLPTDYEPGTATQGHVSVEPKAIARADFNVVRLAMFSGKIAAPPGAQVESIVIRLTGTDRYTTPYQDGSFYFYNLREGDYDVVVDSQTLPEGYLLTSPASARVSPRSFTAPPQVGFELKTKPEPVKPVREILQQNIHVGGQGGTGQQGGSGKGGKEGAGKSGTGSGTRGGSTKGSSGGVGHGGRSAGSGAGRGSTGRTT
ncbi:MAG: hypothetical protein ABSF45_20205 [Terriglobia bacterium]|jgi:hypothetical protein